jgi:hypothetical protein
MLSFNLSRGILRIGMCIGVISLLPRPGEGQTPNDQQSSVGSASRVIPSPVQPAYTPMTGKQRWHRYWSDLAGPGPVAESAASAGINQWRNTPGEWKQGSSAYGYRFASSFGIHVVGQTIESGTAAALGEDNRYVPSTRYGFGPRLQYALTSTVMSRSRNGSRRVSISKIAALTATAFISRTWQPPSTSHPEDAMITLGVSLGISAGGNVARELLPRSLHLSWLLPN